MSSRSRRWSIYALIVLVFAVGTWYFGFRAKPAQRPSGWGFRNSNQAVPVRAVKAERVDLPVVLKAIGTVTPLNTVVVRSRVEGQLLRILFTEGQHVEAGELLAEIDPAPYRIRVAQAEAQLQQNLALVETARNDLERIRQLHRQELVTQQEIEAQQSLVSQREAVLAAGQAEADNARLLLAYTRIEAPISGRLGLRQVDVGNLIRPNDANGIVVITQTRPIAVTFTIPEIDLLKVIEPLRAGETLPVEAWDRSEQNLLARGVLKTVDNQIDLATGTLRLKAEFANADDRLFPNQFVNVRLRVRTLKDALVVPSAAIQFGSRGTYVYAVNDENKANVRDVVLGPSDGTSQSITSGLAPGDLVVLEGLDRLRDGRVVTLVSANGEVERSGEATARTDASKKGN